VSDWNASVYHQVSEPQFRWGLEVLSELALKGDETVIDAGCGTGRITAQLLDRLPRGHVIALDASEAMLERARDELKGRDRVTFMRADLAKLDLEGVADVVFSTATFHWVLDHDALFRGLYRALKPGGRLHAQCGGEGNLKAHQKLALEHAQLDGFKYPVLYASAEDSLARLQRAGFEHARAWLKSAPTAFKDAQSFRAFIEHVTLRTLVAALQNRGPVLLDAVTKASAPSYTLDYVRLELRGFHQ
jgi:ubiquinone/menaquinone biosynthesis C-methylase UbiE